jgi:hypothetical protein
MEMGKRVKLKADQLRIGPTELAKKISTSKPNLYSIFKRDSLDVELVMKISEALEYNFFAELSEECESLLSNTVADYPQPAYKTKEQKLEEELALYKEKYSLLRELYITKHGSIPHF